MSKKRLKRKPGPGRRVSRGPSKPKKDRTDAKSAGRAQPWMKAYFVDYLNGPKNLFPLECDWKQLQAAMFAWSTFLPPPVQNYALDCAVHGKKYNPVFGDVIRSAFERTAEQWPGLGQIEPRRT